MSSKDRGAGSPIDRPTEPGNPSTLRSIDVAEPAPPDHESPPQPVYYEPQPLVAATDHKTIEVETIKLADEIDPRKLPTELRLPRPSSIPPDFAGPPSDVVVVSSQPPLAARHKWRVPVVLLLLLSALVLLVLGRSLAQRSHAAATVAPSAQNPLNTPAPAAAAPNPAATIAAAPTLPAPAEPALSAPPSTSAPPAAAALPAEKSTTVRHKSNPHHASNPNNDPTPSTSSRAFTVPSPSKPKRAIY